MVNTKMGYVKFFFLLKIDITLSTIAPKNVTSLAVSSYENLKFS